MWYAKVQHFLHVPCPEELDDEQLMLLISRVKWLLKNNYVYGIKFEDPATGFEPDEEKLLDKIRQEWDSTPLI
jgi:hypothetical protein